MPWLEVSAERITPDGGVAWSAGQPLPVLGDSELHPERWRCPRHAALFAAWQENERNGVHTLAWRLVHLYRGDAGRSASLARTDALVVRMLERREEGGIAEAWLERQGRETPLAAPVRVRDRTEAKRLLHRQFTAWARWTTANRHAVVDSPMSWAAGEPPAARERATAYPQRLRASAQRARVEGAPGIPAVAWPAPLFEHAQPHPVFGYPPAYWCDLPERDLGPLLNAIVPPCWLTLRPHEWEWNGARAARADLALWHHDGRRWRELRRAAASHSVELAAGAPPPCWDEALLRLARAAAEHAADLAAGRTSLAELARPLLP